MPEPTPFDSVASLLEQILDVAKEQLSVAQDQREIAQHQLDATDELLDVARESLQNLQATNTALASLIAWTKDSNGILQSILESSHRIEKLLGGTGPVPAPASMNVTYQFELGKKAKEQS